MKRANFIGFLVVFLSVGFGLEALAQRITTEEYVEKYKEIAMEAMREYKIPASITLAQGILESGSGNSSLAKKANNHFGIKCHSDWTGKTYYQDDDEKDECFRSYKKVEDSYRDHSLFLTEHSRYAFLFDLQITDYKGWARGLKSAGYATNPKYPQLLINLIESYNLTQYDKQVTSSKKAKAKKEKEEKKKRKEKQKSKKEDKKLSEKPIEIIDIEKTSTINDSITQTSVADSTYLEPIEFEEAYTTAFDRTIFRNNGIPIVVAKGGETPYSIAHEFHIYARQIWHYNNVNKDYVFGEGEIIYLEPKKCKSNDCSFHTIRDGQKMRDVSQLYGVRLRRLCKLNNCRPETEFEAGTNIRVR